MDAKLDSAKKVVGCLVLLTAFIFKILAVLFVLTRRRSLRMQRVSCRTRSKRGLLNARNRCDFLSPFSVAPCAGFSCRGTA